MKSVKTITLAALFLGGSLLTTACDNDRDDVETGDIGSRSSVTYSEVKRDTAKALNTTADYLDENTEEARAELSNRLRTIDDDLAALRLRLSNATADTRAEIQEEIDELEVESRDVRARLSNWGKEATEDVKEWGRDVKEDAREVKNDAKAELHEATAPDTPAEAAKQAAEGDVPANTTAPVPANQ